VIVKAEGDRNLNLLHLTSYSCEILFLFVTLTQYTNYALEISQNSANTSAVKRQYIGKAGETYYNFNWRGLPADT